MPDTSHWLRLYASTNPAVRARAAEALLQRPAEIPLSILLDLAESPDERLRGSAWAGLHGRRDAELLEMILRWTASPDAARRRWACSALGDRQNPEALSHVVGLLQDPDAEVRHMAAHAYAQLYKADVAAESPTAHAMIDPEEDFDWIDELCAAFGERCDGGAFEVLTPAEQAVLLPLWLKEIVDNGGFQFFYEGATEAAEVADAFDRIGLFDLAQACRLSLEVFPERRPPISQHAMFAWMEAQGPDLAEYWERLSRVIGSASRGDLYRAIARYIRTHPAEFPNASP